MKNIFVLGSINYDLVIEAPYMPVKGETIIGKNFMSNSGGKGANQAVACSKLGGKTYLLGAVGNDQFGNQTIAGLKSYGINCEYVQRIKNCSTGVAMIVIEGGDNRIILDSGANHLVSYEKIFRHINGRVCEGDIFLVQLESPLDLVQRGLKLAKLSRAYTILNPAPAAKIGREMLENVDAVIPNETEVEHITGIKLCSDEDMLRAGGAFLNMGVKDVIITLGEKGCAHIHSGGLKKYPAKVVKVKDTTAAGDTFIGALACSLSKGKTIADSIDFCQTAASITVQRVGAQSAIPTLSELSEIYKEA